MLTTFTNSLFSKLISSILVCLFTLNDISHAASSINSDIPTKFTTLAPPLQTTQKSFREKFVLGEFAASFAGIKDYINGQTAIEKRIFEDKWKSRRTKTIHDIYDRSLKGRIRGRVEGLQSVVFVRLAGFLSSTGQAAVVDLTGQIEAGREFGGIPVVYIDSMLSDTPDECIQRHEIDEIIQWEDFRQNVLGIYTNKEMADWIAAHLESSDGKLRGTEYEGMSAILIAELFHGYSYPLRDLYSRLKGTTDLDHDYIRTMLQIYPPEKNKGLIIGAGNSPEDRQGRVVQPVETYQPISDSPEKPPQSEENITDNLRPKVILASLLDAMTNENILRSMSSIFGITFIKNRIQKAIDEITDDTKSIMNEMNFIITNALTGLRPEDITVDTLSQKILPVENEIRRLEEKITVMGRAYIYLKNYPETYAYLNRPGLSIGPICRGINREFVKLAKAIGITVHLRSKTGVNPTSKNNTEAFEHTYAIIDGKDGPIAIDLTFGQFAQGGGKTVIIESLSDYEERISGILSRPQIRWHTAIWSKISFPFVRAMFILKTLFAKTTRTRLSETTASGNLADRARKEINTLRPTFKRDELTAEEFEAYIKDALQEELITYTSNYVNARDIFSYHAGFLRKNITAGRLLQGIKSLVPMLLMYDLPRVNMNADMISVRLPAKTSFIAPLTIAGGILLLSTLMPEYMVITQSLCSFFFIEYCTVTALSIITYSIRRSSLRHELEHVYIWYLIYKLRHKGIIYFDLHKAGNMLGMDQGLYGWNFRATVTSDCLRAIEDRIISRIVLNPDNNDNRVVQRPIPDTSSPDKASYSTWQSVYPEKTAQDIAVNIAPLYEETGWGLVKYIEHLVKSKIGWKEWIGKLPTLSGIFFGSRLASALAYLAVLAILPNNPMITVPATAAIAIANFIIFASMHQNETKLLFVRRVLSGVKFNLPVLVFPIFKILAGQFVPISFAEDLLMFTATLVTMLPLSVDLHKYWNEEHKDKPDELMSMGSGERKNDRVNDEDGDLIRRALLDDQDAYRALYDKYWNKVFAPVYHRLNNYQDAIDVTQEAFIRAFGALAKFRGESEFHTWLYKIAMNLSINKVDSNHRHGQADSLDEMKDEYGFLEPAIPDSRNDPFEVNTNAAQGEIRPARIEDWAEITRLSKLIPAYESDAQTNYLKIIADKDENNIILVYEKEGLVLGYMHAVVYRENNFARILETCVNEKYQRSGIGTALSTLLVNRLISLGIKKIERIPTAPGAVALAKNSGFRPANVNPDGTGVYVLEVPGILQTAIVDEIILDGEKVTDDALRRKVAEMMAGEFDLNVRVTNNSISIGTLSRSIPDAHHGQIPEPAIADGVICGRISKAKGMVLFLITMPDISARAKEFRDQYIKLARALLNNGMPASVKMDWSYENLLNDLFLNAPETAGDLARQPLSTEITGTTNLQTETPPAATTEYAAEDDQLTAQNKPDIENILEILNKLIPEMEKEYGLKYYTVKYDVTKIPQGSSAENLLKTYVKKVLPMYMSGKDRIKLLPSAASEQSLITVECYKDRSRNQSIGEGHVDVDEDIGGKALRLIGMLNIAFIASQIPKDISADEMSRYDNIVYLIKKQYKDISGEDLIVDILKDTARGIWIRLPRAVPIPLEKLEEYYRLTALQLEQAA